MAAAPARLTLVACEVFYRELSAVVARSPNRIDVTWLPQGLHNQGKDAMRTRLQAAIDAAAPEAAAVAIGYGLCGNGLIGLRARTVPLVVPRAHDCITCFLGGRAAYEKEFGGRPGTYWRTSGWIERAGAPDQADQLGFGQSEAMGGMTWEQLVAKYGEEDAQYVKATLTSHLKSYSRLGYIRMGVEPAEEFERRAKAEAASLGWAFESVPGDLGLLQRLVDGPWPDAEFLTVRPGWAITPAWDGSVIGAEPAAADVPR